MYNTPESRCPQRPEGAIKSPGLGVTDSWELPGVSAENLIQSSARKRVFLIVPAGEEVL